MQGITKIKERILEEAAEEKNRIIKEAEKKASEILEKAREKAKEIEIKARERAQKMAAEEKRKILSMAELEEKKRFLEAKQALIDEAFAQAEKKLSSLDEQSYLDLIRRMLLLTSADGNEEVIISENDRAKITPEFLSAVNEALKKQGKLGNLRISEEKRPIRSGFILKSETVEINCAFEYLLKAQRQELETEVARLLFEE
ncbi:V/A-type H+-transporting ATPase subunit E [Caldanaerovirga acetigignens]|uniref:V-type proton ATPase subunit E n=1 Tax=Caldanaerovirga acetigignens TaxID=447595 RepID=A0A1M7KQH7_9FIRM|nr:V-type ATP synthase subunit E family protein [Caldanaerovirga acetigignens]SHM67599.1 V/A-type H+-transporting ATPase subunit E [Caldanaerovirga acetigignens]